MWEFIKKLFGFAKKEEVIVVPYKIEPPVQPDINTSGVKVVAKKIAAKKIAAKKIAANVAPAAKSPATKPPVKATKPK